MVRDYNALPNNVKQAANINHFKNMLDKFRGTPTRNNSRPTVDNVARQAGDQGTR